HRFAMGVEPRAPGVVPHPAQVRLLLETHDLGDVGARTAGGIKGAQLRQATGAGAENGDTKCHATGISLFEWRPAGAGSPVAAELHPMDSRENQARRYARSAVHSECNASKRRQKGSNCGYMRVTTVILTRPTGAFGPSAVIGDAVG